MEGVRTRRLHRAGAQCSQLLIHVKVSMSYAEDRTLYGALRRTNEGNWLEESLEGGKSKQEVFWDVSENSPA